MNREGTLDILHELEADMCRLISRFVYFPPLGALGTHAHARTLATRPKPITISHVRPPTAIFLSYPSPLFWTRFFGTHAHGLRSRLEPKIGNSKWMGGRSIS